MKLEFLLFAIIFIFCACTESKYKKSNLELYGERLLYQYPQFKSNELAKNAIIDSIKAYANSLPIGEPVDLENVPFRFKKLIEGENGYCAAFYAGEHLLIDNVLGGTDKYISSKLYIGAFGQISDSMALKLNSSVQYVISGKLHAIDDKDHLHLLYDKNYDEFALGTLILQNMEVQEYRED